MPTIQGVPAWKWLITHVGLDFLAVGLFAAILLILTVSYGGRLHLVEGSVLLPTVILLVIVAVNVAGRGRRFLAGNSDERRAVGKQALRSIRDWSPLIVLVLVYENLRGLTGLIRKDNIDATLHALDVAWFGVEPTVWAGRFANPWLTDYFAFAYTLYFILPLVLATTLYARQDREDFREMVLGVLLVQYSGFLLYLIFPAGPPRFAIRELFTPAQLTGRFGFFEATQGAFDTMNPNPVHASFPSLHCALSCTALLFAWRFRKVVGGTWLFWCFLPLVVSLWCATVYLRHHWLVDCFAGIGLSLVVFTLTPYLRRFYASLGATVTSP